MTSSRKNNHGRILQRRLEHVKPAPENMLLYHPISTSDPETVALAKSIKRDGILQPIGITTDGYIFDGHRRHVACQMLGRTTIPVRVKPISRARHREKFLRLLRESNRQRLKTHDELLREEVLAANPETAYSSLIEHREKRLIRPQNTIKIRDTKHRAEISPAKHPLLKAVCDVLNDLWEFWPVADRKVHYELLTNPPLIHASKPASTYTNTLKSYQALVDLLSRARLSGAIPWEAISDDSRPVVVWKTHKSVQPFIRSELDGLLKGYWRDLQQSQPNHIEVVCEKVSLGPVIRPVCAQYCITYTLGRGFTSFPPRHTMAERFAASGKNRLVLLFLCDHDPSGYEIAHSFARSMRDDFGVDPLDAVFVALTAEQVKQHQLVPWMRAKPDAQRYAKWVAEHGHHVFEIDALKPHVLQPILRKAIDSVMDIEAFNSEIDKEKQDAAFLDGARRAVHGVLGEMDFDFLEDGD